MRLKHYFLYVCFLGRGMCSNGPGRHSCRRESRCAWEGDRWLQFSLNFSTCRTPTYQHKDKAAHTSCKALLTPCWFLLTGPCLKGHA